MILFWLKRRGRDREYRDAQSRAQSSREKNSRVIKSRDETFLSPAFFQIIAAAAAEATDR